MYINIHLYDNNADMKHCTDEYITRFLLARKYRVEQAAALIGAYQTQIALRQDVFGNLTARDPALQRSLRAGIPGVLPARDRYLFFSPIVLIVQLTRNNNSDQTMDFLFTIFART